MTKFVTIEKGLGPDGRIAVVRFDRGDGINALSPEAIRQLTQAARSFEDDSATSVVVLTGGADAFSAGFLRGLSLGRTPGEAAALGCAAAALVAQGLGSDHGDFDLAVADALINDSNKAVSG